MPSAILTEADLTAYLAELTRTHRTFRQMYAVAGRVPIRRIDPGFRGLFWVVTGQQISTAAGRAIFTRAETALGELTPEAVNAADDALLKTAGLSAPKIRTLRALSEAILSGGLDIEGLSALDGREAGAQLCTIKGIGRWTADVYLLFALGHADIFPSGDLALKEGVRLALSLETRPGEKELDTLAESWRPFRSAAARLTWAYYGAIKRGKADSTPA